MSTTYTIGKLAKAADVPVSTLRYYERTKLLIPSHRTGSNYRVYSEADLSRLRFIKAAQATGFTLNDVRILMGLENGNTHVCEDVQHLLRHRLADVQQRMKDLKHVQKVLRSSIDLCCSGSNEDHCQVIEHLTGQRSSE